MAEIDLSSEQFLDLAAEILNQGHSLRFRARGVSMRPFIRDGDLLEIRSLPSQAVRYGDILLYRTSSARSLVHRVTRIRSQGASRQFLLHGDAVLQADGWIEAGQVLGRVERVERVRMSTTERMSTSDGEGLKVGRLEGLQVEEEGSRRMSTSDKRGKVIDLQVPSQRLLALGLAYGLPVYKKIYQRFTRFVRGK